MSIRREFREFDVKQKNSLTNSFDNYICVYYFDVKYIFKLGKIKDISLCIELIHYLVMIVFYIKKKILSISSLN
jgi:hypothetical protein